MEIEKRTLEEKRECREKKERRDIRGRRKNRRGELKQRRDEYFFGCTTELVSIFIYIEKFYPFLELVERGKEKIGKKDSRGEKRIEEKRESRKCE